MTVFKDKKVTDYVLLYFGFFIYSLVSVFAKFASAQTDYKMIVFLGCEVVLLAIYAILWQQILKRFSLVTAMSNKGITVIFGMLWSVIIFKDTITLWNIFGAAIIISGIYLVSSSE